MTASFTIRPYQPGDEEEILRTFNRVFREVCGEGFVDRTMQTWRWQFEANPAGNRIHLAMAPDGRVAAQYAAVPYRARTPAGPTTFAQIVDSYTHPDFRQGLKRPGLFVQTAVPALDYWEDEVGDGMFFGYPVRAAERIGKRYLNYQVVRVVDFLVRDVAGADHEGPAAVEVRRETQLDDEVDALAARLGDARQCLIERDRAYLDWRYAQSTEADYEFWAARRDGALAGVMVLRPQHDVLVEDACAIADWVVPAHDDEVADALLAAATRRAAERGRKCLIAVFPDPAPEYAHLRAGGFRVVPSADTLERRLTYRINQPGLTVEMLAELWYYTLGDSDLV